MTEGVHEIVVVPAKAGTRLKASRLHGIAKYSAVTRILFARQLFSLCVALAFVVAASQAIAQTWPTKPIKWIVPFAPGGTTDILARTIGDKLAVALGQPVIIENKPGAGGGLGADFVAKAAPDGYTILGGTISTNAINASLYKNLPYDPVDRKSVV